MRLEDTVIVVTGASSGLGKTMADAFVDEGARVVCGARTEPRLSDAVTTIDAGPGEAIGVSADVSEIDDVNRLMTAARETYGPIDVLVNNAAIHQETLTGDPEMRRVDQVSVATWDAIVATNLRGTFLCSRAVLPEMRERDAGRLIHLSSGMGSHGRARWGPYVATKHAVEGLGDTIARECEGTGVSSVLFRPPGGGVFTETRKGIRDPADMAHEPDVVAEPGVQLAAGDGDNGGRYVGTEDGTTFVEYDRSDV